MKPSIQNIVVCFDGTKKELTSSKQSNILKFFDLLSNEGDQKVLYYNGVGSKAPLHSFLKTPTTLDRIIAAASGRDIYRIVQVAYEELSKHCEKDSKVSVLGFSRGAYAARIFAGMLTSVGLPPSHNVSIVPSLFHLYKEGKNARISGIIKPEVVFVGVWDTVESILFAYRSLPKTSYNSDIQIFRHALSVDERRVLYSPMLYSAPMNSDPNRVMELWFSGSHSDVGGRWIEGEEPLKLGQPPNLSNIPLLWMISEFQKNCSGIRFRNASTINEALGECQEVLKGHLNGEIHDNLRTLKGCGWWILEVFLLNFGRARRFINCADCHSTVKLRQDANPSYKPRVVFRRHEGNSCGCMWNTPTNAAAE